MAELADAHGSGPCGSNTMRVQVSFPALENPINTGGLRTSSTECKQKCKQKQVIKLINGYKKGEGFYFHPFKITY